MTKTFKLKLKNNLNRIKEISKKENWNIKYDKDLDTLYIIPKKIPRDARIIKVSKEFAVYATPSADVKGIFAEYFFSSYVKHNPEYKTLEDLFTNPDNEDIQKIDERKKDRAEIYKVDIEKEIVALGSR